MTWQAKHEATSTNSLDRSRPTRSAPSGSPGEREDAVAEQIAYSLNELRERFGISQSELAETLGISQPAVSKQLHGLSTIAALQRLVRALGADLEIVVNHDGERFLIDA